jgi:hypothetical protein
VERDVHGVQHDRETEDEDEEELKRRFMATNLRQRPAWRRTGKGSGR